jgi:cell division initiation protein
MSTRLTAMDIEKQTFTRKMRGLDPDEVQLFLRAVADELGRLNLENQQLAEETAELRERVDEYKDRERALQETLVTAQMMSADLKVKSKAEADLLVKEARFKAERLLEQAQDQLQALENEIGRLRLEKDAFENRLRAAIEEHLSLLDLRRQEKGGHRQSPLPATPLHDRRRMIEADLAVVGISELATPEGSTARLGADLSRLRVVPNARGRRLVRADRLRRHRARLPARPSP